MTLGFLVGVTTPWSSLLQGEGSIPLFASIHWTENMDQSNQSLTSVNCFIWTANDLSAHLYFKLWPRDSLALLGIILLTWYWSCLDLIHCYHCNWFPKGSWRWLKIPYGLGAEACWTGLNNPVYLLQAAHPTCFKRIQEWLINHWSDSLNLQMNKKEESEGLELVIIRVIELV